MSPSDNPPESLEKLFAAHYPELRRLAHSRLLAGGRNTVLDTTALVHESFVRLCGSHATAFPDPGRFFVYAGKVMRSVIVDLVRQRQAERHGGDIGLVTLTTQIEDPANLGEAQILHVDEALKRLAALDPRMAQVVELRYFAGMTEPEIAKALGVTDRTVRRDWQQARLLLAEALR
jgi:RNA polymerase sigma factor (TIGR02999 family)